MSVEPPPGTEAVISCDAHPTLPSSRAEIVPGSTLSLPISPTCLASSARASRPPVMNSAGSVPMKTVASDLEKQFGEVRVGVREVVHEAEHKVTDLAGWSHRPQ